MHRLEGVVRPYAWGSHTALASLRGEPVPAAQPEAELWLGAHPGDPAVIAEGGQQRSLLDVIDASPATELGEAVLAQGGPRLPYLLKLLAAAHPLSLQAHPSMEQARAGFARENAEGVALDSPFRNYRDAFHKPELIVALSEFSALAGFREVSGTVALLRELAAPELEPYVDLLVARPDQHGVHAVFASWMALGQDALPRLLRPVLLACEKYPESGEFAKVTQMATELADEYPADAGILAALLLNRVDLQPGEALYLPAGNMHAYLRGFGVEIMANSDNVLRGGLTPKHVDVEELSRVLDFSPRPAPVLRPSASAGGFARYPAPAREFALWTAQLEPGASACLLANGPRIAVVTAGSITLAVGAQTLELAAGGAAWIPASDPAISVRATAQPAQVFVAAPG